MIRQALQLKKSQLSPQQWQEGPIHRWNWQMNRCPSGKKYKVTVCRSINLGSYHERESKIAAVTAQEATEHYAQNPDLSVSNVSSKEVKDEFKRFTKHRIDDAIRNYTQGIDRPETCTDYTSCPELYDYHPQAKTAGPRDERANENVVLRSDSDSHVTMMANALPQSDPARTRRYLNAEQSEASTICGRKYLEVDGYVYSINKKHAKSAHYRCSYQGCCQAKLTLFNDGAIHYGSNDHSEHCPSRLYLSVNDLYTGFKMNLSSSIDLTNMRLNQQTVRNDAWCSLCFHFLYVAQYMRVYFVWKFC